MKTSKSPLTLSRNTLRALVLINVLGVAAFAQTATDSNSADRNVNDRPMDQRTTNGSRLAPNQTAPDRVNSDSSTAGRMSATDANGSMNSAMAKPGWGDKRFLHKAAKSGMEEVAISQIALEKASNPDVKEFARMMINDHQKVNGQLTTTASDLGVSLTDQMGDKDDVTSKWQKKEAGTEFDRDYMDKMVSDHEDAIDLFSKGAKSDVSQIASLASGALPKLQQHYSRAQELQRQLKQQ